MRLAACIVPSLLLLATSRLPFAQEEPQTDRQRDSLAGVVRSITATRLSEATKEQLKDIPFGIPAGCAFCEYDPDGNRITNGRIAGGEFVGQRTLVQRNPDGMMERITTVEFGSSAPGTSQPPLVVQRDLAGPFGALDSTFFQQDGKVTVHQKFEYDTKGHLSAAWTIDGSGVQISHETYRWTADGQRQELVSYGKGDVLRSSMTWDPDTDESRYTCFEPSGGLLESWSVAQGKVLSFWEAADNQAPCNAHLMFADAANGDFIRYTCERNTGCKVEHSDSQYLGPGKRDVRHTDFRDSAGQIKWTSDYEYEFDSNGNWTHRKVWVTFPGDGGRVLSSEDARTITYWDN
jgi:hypothetical protein